MPLFLKIILCFLLFLLAVFIVVLVCPVTYKLHFRKQEEEVCFTIKANYLLGLLHFMFRYPGQEQVVIRVFGFPLRKKKDKTDTQESRPEQQEQKMPCNDDVTVANRETLPAETKDFHAEPRANENTSKVATKENEVKRDDVIQQDKESIFTKCKNLKKEWDFYRKLLEAEFTQCFIKEALKRILQILGGILPKKLKGYIRFGGNTPDITGLAMAGYGMVFCNRRGFRNFTFDADFENPVFEGEIWIKGSILPAFVVWNATILLFDKRLSKIRKVLKAHKNRKLKEENKDGR